MKGETLHPVGPGSDDSAPDREARHAIAEDLDTTLVVEAAAGTGKTTELVKRILRVLATGRSISAMPTTGPLWVRNVNLTATPCCTAPGRNSKPPLREMTCSSPATRRPFWNSRRAGVVSLSRNRGTRRFESGWGE